MQIGVYGGRFDPIHLGHLLCAELTGDAFGLDRVLFVTSANPVHREAGSTPARERHRMVEAACSTNPRFEACDLELRRAGPSRTFDTLAELQRLYCEEAEISLLTSSEYLDPAHPWHLTRWHRGPELLERWRLLVFLRPGHQLSEVLSWVSELPQARTRVLEVCPSPPISSTLVRERVRRGESIRYLVLPEVSDVIAAQGLYR